MRRGELLGLRWQDVDLESGTIAVQQALEETRAGVRVKQPKTAKGRHSITLPAVAVEELRSHLREQQGQADGPGCQGRGLLLPRPNGEPWAPDEFTWEFSRAVRSRKLPRVRFHDLRHTHATLLLRQGVHPKVVSERLGHATISITLDTYSHVMPGMQEEAARRVDLTLRGLAPNGN